LILKVFIVKNQVNKNAMKRASKEYKREMSKSFKEYQLKTATALSNVGHLNEKFNPECTSENKGLKSST
jgi:uncharacterized protein (UPF0147 family)